MRSRCFLAIAIMCAVIVASGVVSVAQRGPAPTIWPGNLGKGVTLLPNG